ncbi:MAG: hypothetical protein OEO21_12915, partial [Candidatus Krumholzibacteria bacterium]|nr:hypothetical protein [Candidatus Krumholzibacteria bacterium]
MSVSVALAAAGALGWFVFRVISSGDALVALVVLAVILTVAAVGVGMLADLLPRPKALPGGNARESLSGAVLLGGLVTLVLASESFFAGLGLLFLWALASWFVFGVAALHRRRAVGAVGRFQSVVVGLIRFGVGTAVCLALAFQAGDLLFTVVHPLVLGTPLEQLAEGFAVLVGFLVFMLTIWAVWRGPSALAAAQLDGLVDARIAFEVEGVFPFTLLLALGLGILELESGAIGPSTFTVFAALASGFAAGAAYATARILLSRSREEGATGLLVVLPYGRSP